MHRFPDKPGYAVALADPHAFEGIIFEEVHPGHPDYDQAFPAPAFLDEPSDEVLPQVMNNLADSTWWVHMYWRKKFPPIEQITLQIGNWCIDAYNFLEPLLDGQVAEMADVVGLFARVKLGKVFQQVQYLLFDNQPHRNPKSGDLVNGEIRTIQKAVLIFPNAVRQPFHRVRAVSNLKGTLIHELAHELVDEIKEPWIKQFGWQKLDRARPLPGGYTSNYENLIPQRCVTDYALHDPSEDVCESMVAAVSGSAVLDPEKREFLHKEFLANLGSPAPVVLTRKTGEEVTFPSLPNPFCYRRMIRGRSTPVSVRSSQNS